MTSLPSPAPQGAPEPTLLACPFCESEAATLPLESEDRTGENGGAPFVSWWRVTCGGCGVMSNGAHSEREAIREWNRRAPVSSVESREDETREVNALIARVESAHSFSCGCGFTHGRAQREDEIALLAALRASRQRVEELTRHNEQLEERGQEVVNRYVGGSKLDGPRFSEAIDSLALAVVASRRAARSTPPSAEASE